MTDRALWHGQAHMPTSQAQRLVVTDGDGAWLTTSDGRRLLDATAGLWHANVGHGRERIARAAYEQMRRLETYHVFGRFANEPALDLADRLADLGPVQGGRVMLTSGGSDSVDLACKLVRRHWQLEGRPEKTVVVSRETAYHGLHGFGTSIAGLPYNREGYGSASLVPETLRIPAHDLAAALAQLDAFGTDRVAAIILEPVIGTGGVFGPVEGYLEGLQAFARERDVLLVVDEVITGFGRTGVMFASERYALEPDLVLMAKGLTSGYAPLGAVLVAPRVADRFFDGDDAPMFRHGLTYSGHATACAVAHANLDVLEEENLVERAAHLEKVLADAVQPLADHPLVHEVRAGAGFLAGVQVVDEVRGDDVAQECVRRGVLTRTIHANTLQICPPFVTTEDEVQLVARTVADALDTF
ncbi:adenosylmethionine-8-amino-7-oxononanoate aminotransferase [Aeromicrobium sp. SORGH_AS981]|uniref:aminotransferase family protein n=1 Tax=Aeromicrobium sp. SORGH_AS_0981 TaxID=3041802 RepID=UPI00286416F8|nr:aminotransferase class III-fold pyridoxal phosphate-dependent enzyme [Aeromicrobium sp. SORGH_AS_0981]MDR6117318.1 adenosylmethionine-8-amino-7-oxononanoate aminotransferase [Aeromicrobium sp. SORGH_AS_0981]